jgi:hypothetical protein
LQEAEHHMSEADLRSQIDLDAVRIAMEAPFLTVDGSLIYPDPVEQAAILAARIIDLVPMPFNVERSTALLFADIRLQNAGLELSAPASEIDAVFTAISNQRIPDDVLITWFSRRARLLRTRT